MDWIAQLVAWVQKLDTPLKVAVTAMVMTIATFAVALIWQKPADSPAGPRSSAWTKTKSFQALKYTLERTSDMNRKLLLAVLDAGRNGIYSTKLAQSLDISEGEVVYRAKDLYELGLVEILPQTAMNIRIHDDVFTAVGPNGNELLRSLLK